MDNEEIASLLRKVNEQLNRIELRQVEILERLKLFSQPDIAQYASELTQGSQSDLQPYSAKGPP